MNCSKNTLKIPRDDKSWMVSIPYVDITKFVARHYLVNLSRTLNHGDFLRMAFKGYVRCLEIFDGPQNSILLAAVTEPFSVEVVAEMHRHASSR